MFDTLKSLGRAAVGAALLPIDVAVDVATVQPSSQAAKRCRQIGKALDRAVEGEPKE